MTLVLRLGLDVIKMYHHTKNEVSLSRYSEAIAQTDTQTDTQADSMKKRSVRNQVDLVEINNEMFRYEVSMVLLPLMIVLTNEVEL